MNPLGNSSVNLVKSKSILRFDHNFPTLW